ncbi:MAG: hypothetical protein JNK73_04785 [Bacteroidia bacterium]|nr:hypothetical protein [Bacteroidia bacterium]
MSEQIARARIIDQAYIELEFLIEDVALSKEDVAKGWLEANTLDPQKKFPVLLLTAKWSLPENEAFKQILAEINSRPIVAVVVHDLSQRLVGNFTLNLTGKSKNIKLFDEVEAARTWLIKKIASRD